MFMSLYSRVEYKAIYHSKNMLYATDKIAGTAIQILEEAPTVVS